MSTQETTTTSAEELVADNIRGVRDSLSVKRAFGDSYEVDGVTIIPVARVAGGAGGGAAVRARRVAPAGTPPAFTTVPPPAVPTRSRRSPAAASAPGSVSAPDRSASTRSGDGTVEWKPAIDVNRIVRGGQALAGVIAICVAAILWNRR